MKTNENSKQKRLSDTEKILENQKRIIQGIYALILLGIAIVIEIYVGNKRTQFELNNSLDSEIAILMIVMGFMCVIILAISGFHALNFSFKDPEEEEPGEEDYPINSL